MKYAKRIFYIGSIIICFIILPACRTTYFRFNYQNANKLLHDQKNLVSKPFLKAHLKNGEVCIFQDNWQVDTIRKIVTGEGKRYNLNRKFMSEGATSIPIDSVSIFETNRANVYSGSGGTAASTIILASAALPALGILAVAIFGSCPTFYMNESDNFQYADAESFSNAIAPSLEYFDIDALNNNPLTTHAFSITMKNEALETHCVNSLKLLAFPRNNTDRIYHFPPNNFYLCNNTYPVTKATGNEGDITSLLQNADRKERFSLSDEKNLIAKEEIYLDFENVKNQDNLGIIINYRQTLMTTYLIYNMIGYMGENVGDIFAGIERKNFPGEERRGFTKNLGNIDVYRWNEKSKKWELQGGLYETGPIAINRQILPLKNITSGSKIKLKLVFTKGLWRFDYLALTNMMRKVEPIEIVPNSILNNGNPDAVALASINQPDKHLVSMPGSEYKFNFSLPDQNDDYELFLYSKGYYLEWMRDDWVKNKNLFKLWQINHNPKRYFKSEAKKYKLYEKPIEQEFWKTKIDTKTSL